VASSRRSPLGQHFVIEEFDSHDGARVPARDEGAIAHLVEWWLEPLHAFFGPVTVHSGYRSPAQNRAVGGVRYSVHLLRTPLPRRGTSSTTRAAAADVTCATGNPAMWAAWAREHRHRHAHLMAYGRGGIGHYSTFVHLDTGPARDWDL
jgi:hypothetical protein